MQTQYAMMIMTLTKMLILQLHLPMIGSVSRTMEWSVRSLVTLALLREVTVTLVLRENW